MSRKRRHRTKGQSSRSPSVMVYSQHHVDTASMETQPTHVLRKMLQNPERLHQNDVLQLQRTIGNQRVCQLLSQRATQHRNNGSIQRLRSDPNSLKNLSAIKVPRHLNKPWFPSTNLDQNERTYAVDQEILSENLTAYDNLLNTSSNDVESLQQMLRLLDSILYHVNLMLPEIKKDRDEYRQEATIFESAPNGFPFEAFYQHLQKLSNDAQTDRLWVQQQLSTKKTSEATVTEQPIKSSEPEIVPKGPVLSEPVKTEAQAPPPKTTISGVIAWDAKTEKFVVDDPIEGRINVDAGKFSISNGTAVEYRVEKPNKFIKKAVIVSAGKKPEATNIQQEMAKANAVRTKEIQTKGYFDLSKLELRGVKNVSGARKHYGDAVAVARSDSDVKNLLQTNPFVINDVKETSDMFKIDLGKPNSIVGEIEYTDKTKTKVSKLIVFHVGPSQ